MYLEIFCVQFKLEDATKVPDPPSTPSFIRRPGLQSSISSRPSSAPVETADTTTVTLPLRRPKSQDDKGTEIFRICLKIINYHIIKLESFQVQQYFFFF